MPKSLICHFISVHNFGYQKYRWCKLIIVFDRKKIGDVYVKGEKPSLLEATLSIRNSDPKEDIALAFVRYYDTNGKLIKEYLEKPMLRKSLVTAEFVVTQKEIERASGASFLVEWISDTKTDKPVIEAVMTVNCPTLRPAGKM